MNTLGHKIKTLRKEKQLTQVEVAAAIGVSRPFLTAIENGREYPGRETLRATANFFNVSLDWLTGDEPDESTDKAQNKQETLLLNAFRSLPKNEAEIHLQLMLQRVANGKA